MGNALANETSKDGQQPVVRKSTTSPSAQELKRMLTTMEALYAQANESEATSTVCKEMVCSLPSTSAASPSAASLSAASPSAASPSASHAIYNNYFSKPIGIENYFTNVLGGSKSTHCEPQSTLPDVARTNDSESIRINLPDLLDENDEITILRLLIQLLSSKVGRLGEEKRQLLEHMSELNEINLEMSHLIASQFK